MLKVTISYGHEIYLSNKDTYMYIWSPLLRTAPVQPTIPICTHIRKHNARESWGNIGRIQKIHRINSQHLKI